LLVSRLTRIGGDLENQGKQSQGTDQGTRSIYFYFRIRIIPLGFSKVSHLINLAAGTIRASEKDGMIQVYVPEGSFKMGSDEEAMLAE
jgi:hypothetical protein